MNNQEQAIYTFGPFELRVQERRLFRDGEPVSIGYRPIEILTYLIENSYRPIHKDELREKIWSGIFLDPNNLSVQIHNLRKALGESQDGENYIQTIPGFGYRFRAGVQIRKVLEAPDLAALHIESNFSSKIKEISPRFIVIYEQANLAAQQNLYEICGTGYRKALEVLLKDYALMRFPREREKITEQSLLDCIRHYIHNNKLKEIAAQAVWLGNWETHYLYNWEGKSIDDLKIFINLIVREVESDLEIEKLESGNSDKDSKRKWWQF